MKSLITFASITFFSLSAWALSPPAPEKPAEKDAPKLTKEEVLAPRELDIVYGNPDAPIVMVEYASLSCPHCKHFHRDVLPILKKEYIDSGKLVVYHRFFPHNGPAFYATMLVACLEPERREKFLDVLFELQERWAFTEEFQQQLQKIALVGGVSEEKFTQCTTNKELEKEILTAHKQADETLEIKGIPSFFINGNKQELVLKPEAFKEALDAALAKASVE